MLHRLRFPLTLLAMAATGPAFAAGPPILQNPDAIVVTGIYAAGTPCGRVTRDNGSFVLIPTPLHGIAPGTRVTVRGERMSDRMGCIGPALVIRGWQPVVE